MILPKYHLHYIFYIVFQVHYQHSSRARYLNFNVKCDKFYKRLKLIFYSPTIIVKSVGKVAFFTSSFPSSPRPWANVDQTLMFVRVIVLLYRTIE